MANATPAQLVTRITDIKVTPLLQPIGPIAHAAHGELIEQMGPRRYQLKDPKGNVQELSAGEIYELTFKLNGKNESAKARFVSRTAAEATFVQVANEE